MSFGHSVALGDDTVIVGAYDEDDGSTTGAGGVYFLGRTDDALLLHDFAPAPERLGHFGAAVDTDGRWAVAGGHVGSGSPGYAQVYYENGPGMWGVATTLTGSGDANANFGLALRLRGTQRSTSR